MLTPANMRCRFLNMDKHTNEDRAWLHGLKARIHSSQIKAALAVNEELIKLYWQLGHEILEKEESGIWGKKLIDRLSADLLEEFPSIRGFSRSNLYYVKQCVSFYSRKRSIVQQLVGQLACLFAAIAMK